MSQVFVVDTSTQPLDPVHPGRARLLLSSGRAAVWRRFPFTIMLKQAGEQPQVQHLRLKVDPGSRVTGMAVVNEVSGEVVLAAELAHRGGQIKAALARRRAVRRSRRQRKTRYRESRFANRRRPAGWLPPSLESRIANVLTWTRRLMRVCPITAISLELVAFDLQKMEKPEISGVEYQQGSLYGYEVRQYLLEKWGRACTYCDARDVPLQVEHIVPRVRGGSDRVSNLCLACERCNLGKGTQGVGEFLKHDQERLAHLLAQAQAPLRDATAVNATRWALYEGLKDFGVPIECGSGGLTKYNRLTRQLGKAHWIDAACVGRSTPQTIDVRECVPFLIKARGHRGRQMCRMDQWGFPRTGPKRVKRVEGFQTGDTVRAVVPDGKKMGGYFGRVVVRASGSFNITTAHRTVQGISYRFCSVLHRCDGYEYGRGNAVL